MTMASTMLSGAGHAYGPLPTKITPISGATSSLATGASASAGTSGQSSARWLAAYFVCNLTLTIYNKAVMQFTGFRFPWTLTGIHALCSAIGCYICVYGLRMFRPRELNSREMWVMGAFSLLYTINIAISNVSLNMVTVPFHQVVRATTPVFAVIMSYAWLGTRYSTMVYVSLVPVIIGVAFATLGEYDFTMLGFVLTLLGTFLAALKTIVTNQVQVGTLKLHPLDLLLRMSPLAAMQCVIYAWMTGEIYDVLEYTDTKMTASVFWALVFNGVIAFFLNIVSFTANKKTSALTMTVAANVKQVLSIVLAVSIFSLHITALNGLGIFITLVGGAWYTKLEMEEKQRKNQLMQLPIHGDGSKVASTVLMGDVPMSVKTHQ